MEKHGLNSQKEILKLKRYAFALRMLFFCVSLFAFTNVSEKQLKYKSSGLINIQDRNAELRMKIYEKEKSFEDPIYGNPQRHLFLLVLGMDN
jgi:hypothetical protein